MSRKPFIKPRPAAFDKRHGIGDERTAEVGAGDQCVIITASTLRVGDKRGLKVDLSFADSGPPFMVLCDLARVPVPSYYFDHLVEVEKSGKLRLPTAKQCAEFVGEARRLIDTDDLDAEVIIEMLTEQLADMHITL